MSTLIKVVALIVLGALLIIIMPLATIWSVNVLFPALNIPYTFDTWASTVILGLFFRGATTSSKS